MEARLREKIDTKRKTNNREVRDKFLIVCEGEETEPNYFEKFPINKEIIKIDIKGEGYNTDSLVQKTIELKAKESYNQVWCVFDRDSFPSKNFNRAIELAKNNKIKVAYSNQSFELWYLLHYVYLDSSLARDLYGKKLSDHLSIQYEKNSESMYDILKIKQKQAIKNAEKLFQSYTSENPEKNDPSTTVHHLVQEINKFL